MNDATEVTASSLISFGPFRFDRTTVRLQRGADQLSAPPQTLHLLDILITRSGDVVTKDELRRELWPAGGGSDYAMSRAIFRLRELLGDDSRDPCYIRTIHGRGFCWIAPVHQDDGILPPSATALLGRDGELAALHRAAAESHTGQTRIVVVEGESGIGKSRLVGHSLDVGLDGGRVLMARCITPRTDPEPYRPLLEAVDRLVSDDEQALAVLRRFAPTWWTQLPWLSVHGDPDADTEAGGVERMSRELVRFAFELASTGPLAVVVDDLHWADSATLEAIDALRASADGASLLVVVTTRPVDDRTEAAVADLLARLGADERCTRIVLGPLGIDVVRALIARRFGSISGIESLIDSLMTWTGGNPLFLHLSAAFTIAQGWLRHEPEGWSLTIDANSPELGVLPDTISRLVLRRLDSIPVAQLEVLEAASVVGEAIALPLVAAALDEDLLAVESVCEELVRSTSIFERSPAAPAWPESRPTSWYRFSHSTYQLALYERIGIERRRRMHRSIAERLALADVDVHAWSATIAQHFQLAGDDVAAAPHLLAAGWQARRRCAFRRAHALFEAALGCLDRIGEDALDEQLIQARMGLAVSFTFLPSMQSDATITNMDALERLVEAQPENRRDFTTWLNLFFVNDLAGRADRIRTIAPTLLALAQRSGRDEDLMDAGHALGEGCVQAGEFDEAARRFELARSHHEAASMTPGSDAVVRRRRDSGARIMSALAATDLVRGNVDRVLPRLREALALCDDEGPNTPLVRIGNLGISAALSVLIGELDEARVFATSCVELAEPEHADFVALADAVMWATASDGSPPEPALWERLLTRPAVPFPLGPLMLLAEAVERGHHDIASAWIEQLSELAHRRGSEWPKPELARLRGRISESQSSSASGVEARACYETAISTARAQGAQFFERRAAADLMRLDPDCPRRSTA